jgi:hypothetical protein
MIPCFPTSSDTDVHHFDIASNRFFAIPFNKDCMYKSVLTKYFALEFARFHKRRTEWTKIWLFKDVVASALASRTPHSFTPHAEQTSAFGCIGKVSICTY